MNFTRNDFGNNFSWGVSSAAYQVEGAARMFGKGPSIWDEFVQRTGKIKDGSTAEVSCDFYHRYPQDLTLMHSLNIPNFRFSISWSRLFPNGIGHINKAGVDHYNRLIDFCLELGIVPWVTLYHWDLPLALESRGGWANREIVHWFETYVACCVKHFGDRVKNWIVLNEPVAFTGAGYMLGVHAPGKKNLESFFAAAHHATLCQAAGARILRSWRSDLKIGTTFSTSDVHPYSNSIADEAAAKRMDVLLNRFFLEPLLGMGYPCKDFPFLTRIEKHMSQHDEQLLKFEMDFIGLQNYTREVVSHSRLIPYVNARIVTAEQRQVNKTSLGWEIYPPCIYNLLHKFNRYHNMPAIVVTENGAAFPDEVIDSQVDDQRRVQYLRDHLEQVLLAKNEGVNVAGYFVWTFTDNFEWAEGYQPRFGLVHVDFTTQKRTVKKSGRWYQRFLAAERSEQPNVSLEKTPVESVGGISL
jgi:beta-glucosidase